MDKSMYKGVYVFIEQREGMIQNVAFELLTKARELADTLNEKVYAILLGDKIADKAIECVYFGADTVLCVDAPELKEYITEPYAQAVCQLVKEYHPSILLIGATTIGRDLGPRVSARLGTGLTADCTALAISEDRDLMMTRPAFGGNLMATILCKEHRPQMSTVRPGVMRIGVRDTHRKGDVKQVKITFDSSKFKVRLVKTVKEEKQLVDITEANILVSGGRGVGNSEGFEMLRDFAKTINAEVSSSRAMVDAGVMSHDRQVGQTGKTVRPDVYFALGISGAIQHLAGMEESEFIIAINKDKFAPIFQAADLGIVGDVKQIIPLLIEKLKSLKS
ncbi:electron transfer flavoprotein subunit alpha/FixB family protein [Bacteroides sp. 214]|uniref:electron transfer flavoprotein subunit alpha/FixB family protein n=1 Tax=Bacteroides sp. 214 TaxID=2302935 RepID=UPI0013D3EE90|nr:electron transfer flavoprotein subunit alpha/FixB family protein [Bacteroides sp. 214]NDW11875.1 electron transfer flavoprotein subunit alpha/FixB family protein [Bacteroides sp. 214]